MKKLVLLTVGILLSLISTAQKTPVEINGRLKLVGNQLSSECGKPVQLRGMSTHGVQWFRSCIEKDSYLETLKNDWGGDVARLAMYVEEGGYNTNPNSWKTWIDRMVDKIGSYGLYCIIDWHILKDNNPMANLELAKDFWAHMSEKHKDKKHVIYEICNEPNGTAVTWPVIKQYADTIIPIIRKNDPEAIIIVGTPEWSGRPSLVVGNKLTGDNGYNVMYAFHFYAATHSFLLSGVKAAAEHIPIFASEWGTGTSDGNGIPDANMTNQFMEVFNGNNPGNQKISWCNWSYSDANEGSGALLPGSCLAANFNNVSTSGQIVKNLMNTPDEFIACDDLKPFILANPQNTTVKLGEPTQLKVAAIGDSLTYQWQKSFDLLSWSDVPSPDSAKLNIAATVREDSAHYRVIVTNSKGADTSNTALIKVLEDRPYFGTPLTIPGIIEAEYFDIGAPNSTYYDNSIGNNGNATFRDTDVDIETTGDPTGTYNVGWTDAGEWLKYSVNVTASDKYDFAFRVANGATASGFLSVKIDGITVIPSVTVPSSGANQWQKYNTVIIEDIDLTEGEHTMTISFATGNINLNYVDIYASPTGLDPKEITKYISLYPNPAEDKLTLNSDAIDLRGKTVEIYDALGQKVGEYLANTKSLELDVQALKSGIYTLRLPYQGRGVYLKWIKS